MLCAQASQAFRGHTLSSMLEAYSNNPLTLGAFTARV